jgi:hypothetical protein
MLTKGFWSQAEAFSGETSEPEGCFGSLNGEVAKWQNRVIPSSVKPGTHKAM